MTELSKLVKGSGALSKCTGAIRHLHTSSGTTGKPKLWARGDTDLHTGRILCRRIINESFGLGPADSVLVVICARFNGWIAGGYTFLAFHEIAYRDDFNITIYAPGSDVERLNAYIEDFYQHFANIIFFGAPQFLHRLFTAMPKPTRPNVYIYTITSSDKATLSWKRQIDLILGQQHQSYRHVNAYGSADAGLIAHETAFSMALYEMASQDHHFASELLGPLRLDRPFSVMRFDRQLLQIDTDAKQQLLITAADKVIPLHRYPSGDIGRVISYEHMLALVKDKPWFPQVKDQLDREADSDFLVFMGREHLHLCLGDRPRIYADTLSQLVDSSMSYWPELSGDFCYCIDNQQRLPILTANVGLVEGSDVRPLAGQKLKKYWLSQLTSEYPEIAKCHSNGQFDLHINVMSSSQLEDSIEQFKLEQVDAIAKTANDKANFVTIS